LPSLWQLGAISAQFGRIIEDGLGLDPDVFYGDMPHPPAQPQIPADAQVAPAVDVFAKALPDLDAITVPAMPEDLEVTQKKGLNIMGVTFASTFGALVGLYAYVLPLVLYAVWVAIAIWEVIVRRDDLGTGGEIGWILAILVIPFLGVIAYYVIGKSKIPVSHRWVLLAGGMGAYLLFLVLGLFLGDVV
jgi:hypothetical protein